MYTQKQIVSVMRCAIADLEGMLPEADPSGNREHSGWKTLDELNEWVNILEKHTVMFTWTIEDVQGIREDLNNEQAFQVLEQCENNHDADIGMNWDTIEIVADEMFPIKSEGDE